VNVGTPYSWRDTSMIACNESRSLVVLVADDLTRQRFDTSVYRLYYVNNARTRVSVILLRDDVEMKPPSVRWLCGDMLGSFFELRIILVPHCHCRSARIWLIVGVLAMTHS